LEDLDGLLQRLQVLGGEKDGRGATVAGQDESFVLPSGPVDQIGEMSLGFGERDRLARGWSEF
jgi:hypothetical protein